MKKKKVLFLTNIISPYINDLFNHLSIYDEIDFVVKACAYTEPDRKWSLDFLKTSEYEYEIIKDTCRLKQPGKNRVVYLGGWSVILEILQNKYDVIIFKGGTRFIGPVCVISAKLRGIKIILWEQNSFNTTNTFFKKLFKKLYINDKIFDKFIAYGSHVKELILNFNPDSANKIELAFSAINNDKFRKRYEKLKNKRKLIRKKLNINENEKIVLFIGRFVKEKNLFNLINAMNLIKKSNKNIKCIMVGNGNFEKEIKEKVDNLKLNDVVKIVEFQQLKKLTMFYALADVFVIPSAFDHWPIVAAEAMNFALPVVTSDKAGIKDIIENGQNGYIYKVNNDKQLADSIIKALKNRKKFGINAYQTIEKINFDQVCETLVSAVKA